MTIHTVKAYQGTDPKNGGESYFASFTASSGKIECVTGHVVNEQTAELYGNPEIFMLFVAMGGIPMGEPSEWAHKFLEGNPTLLWETEADGEFELPEGDDDGTCGDCGAP